MPGVSLSIYRVPNNLDNWVKFGIHRAEYYSPPSLSRNAPFSSQSEAEERRKVLLLHTEITFVSNR